MAQTHRETILRAVTALIVGAGVAPVFRSRRDALERKELPAIVVMPGGEQNQRLGSHRVARSFQVLVEVHAKASSEPGADSTADQSADPVIAALHAALFAEKTFGGKIADLIDREMQEPQFTDGDETRVAITLVYEAIYATAERDITNRINH